MMLAVAPTHLLAIVALGLLAGQGGRSGLVPALFMVGMLAGSLAVASAIRETPSALVLLAMAALAGIAVAAAIGLPSVLVNLPAFATGAAFVIFKVTVAVFDSSMPSLALKLKLSLPKYPALGW
jgi:hypothetical protein